MSDEQCHTAGGSSCGSWFGHKYDYTFYNDAGFRLDYGIVAYDGGTPEYEDGELSDHWMLIGSVKRR